MISVLTEAGVSLFTLFFPPLDLFILWRGWIETASTPSESTMGAVLAGTVDLASRPNLAAVGGGVVCVPQDTTSTIGLWFLNLGTVDAVVEGLSFAVRGLTGLARRTSRYTEVCPRTSLAASDRVDGRDGFELRTDGTRICCVSGRDDGPDRVKGRADPGRERTWTRLTTGYPGGKIARAGGGGIRR